MYQYSTNGVCAKDITFDVENGAVKNVKFTGGCNGNLQGIASLVEGMEVDKLIDKLSGIKCGNKNTSCPDQLSKALLKIKNHNDK
ncbi:TIGR03905 family TSCPD domain-containing protein [Tissierella sp. MSJ-40]|uniref:ribonucleoside-diphosphate reductase n=1 Tax=Tissierella simiarum TaxID=2841534 RepID=A0ABS6E5X1_9FIRM|nr:TIGR03905 family TSCPD domain-containing protein [Tissierella simiarum]MBU5438236.1 TIGR03905 family TSCPD domain-containing protein [Tissierella simiarum]